MSSSRKAIPNEVTLFWEETDEDITGEVILRVSLYIHDMLHIGQITEKTCHHLTSNIDRIQHFR